MKEKATKLYNKIAGTLDKVWDTLVDSVLDLYKEATKSPYRLLYIILGAFIVADIILGGNLGIISGVFGIATQLAAFIKAGGWPLVVVVMVVAYVVVDKK